jgi:hypothetical protein
MSSTGAAVIGDSFDLDDDRFPVEVPPSLHSDFNALELLLLSGNDGTSFPGGGGMARVEGGVVWLMLLLAE